MVYEGTYGIFSVALVITIAYSYAMEKNESLENVVMYVVVALAAFSAQLNLGTEDFEVAGLGTTGCFAAMFIGYLSCMAFSKLRRCHKLMLEQYTAGMGGGCVLAIRTLIPLGIVAAGSGGLNLLIGRITGIYGCYQWFNHIFYAACQNIADYSNFLSGLLYTFAVNLMWFSVCMEAIFWRQWQSIILVSQEMLFFKGILRCVCGNGRLWHNGQCPDRIAFVLPQRTYRKAGRAGIIYGSL